MNGGSWRDRKVYVGTPMGFSEDGPFASSSRRLTAYEALKPPRERLYWQLMTAAGLYVGDNRQRLCEAFLESPANWLLMIDSDLEFPRTILEGMLSAAAAVGARVLAASVPIGDTYPTCGYEWVRGEPGVYRSVPIGREPRKVEAVATACCLIHRDALYAIADVEGQKWFLQDIVFPRSEPGTPPREFRYLQVGEDIAFSIRAGAVGVDLWCFHLPGLGHWKRKRYSHDDEGVIEMAAAGAEVVEELGEGGHP